MVMKAACMRGVGRVIGVDLMDYRLETARKTCNAETLHIKDEKAIDEIREMTNGRGADICIDAVGMGADRSIIDKLATIIKLEKGTINALKMAFSAVRRGGFVSVPGVYG